VVNPLLQIDVILLKRLAQPLAVYHHIERGQEEDNEEGGDAVAPDVHTLVVDHEETPEDLAGSVKVDAVAMGDVAVVLHELRGSVVVADVMVFIGRPVLLLLLALKWLLL